MINAVVCDAPAGIDGSGRTRVSGLPWAPLLPAAVAVTGGAMPAAAGVRGVQHQPVVVPAVVTAAELRVTKATAGTPFGTTNSYSTLGNHSPGRPLS
jgi:hypothetical protein